MDLGLKGNVAVVTGGASGIGLACARKLIERLGGEIACESDGSAGSTFVLSLPSGF